MTAKRRPDGLSHAAATKCRNCKSPFETTVWKARTYEYGPPSAEITQTRCAGTDCRISQTGRPRT